MSRFLNDRFKQLVPYVPGEQPTDMSYIKLNTNESPYPPSPKVHARMTDGEIDRLRLYPDPLGSALRAKAAAVYGVRPENIFLANGSDEALALAFLAFCGWQRPAVFPDITYGFYPVYCALFDVPSETIPLREDFTVDVEAYCGIGRNVILANPNAPTGLAVPVSDIERILQSNPDNLVLVDEAYVDFGAESAVGLIGKYDNLLVVHTCSKSWALAGARLGFVFGQPALIEDIDRMRYSFNSYNVTRQTLLAGEAALDDLPYYTEMRGKIVRTRERSARALKALGFELTDSKANFLFARYPGKSGGELYQNLKAMGILVRHFDKPRISDYLRITIGTDAQMDALVEALKRILEK
jgi:histidinol-phosphate aminotransferase